MNKKWLIGSLLGLVCLGVFFSYSFFKTGDKPILITLNGQAVNESAAQLIDGQVMVPLSFIANTFGIKVEQAAVKPNVSKNVYYSNQVAVLMYHHIMEKPIEKDIISDVQFDEQMGLLRSKGYHVIGLKEYEDFMLRGKSVPDNAVLITFDDGYESVYQNAFPILKKYGYPAVSFVIVSKIDDRKQPGIAKLTWDQMREMKQSGIDFMNHTYNMHGFGATRNDGGEKPKTIAKLYLKDKGRQETEAEYRQRLLQDLSQAEKRLKEELGNTSSTIAFPFGKYNKQLLGVMKELGIPLSFTVQNGINTSKDHNGYRINMGRSDVSPETLIEKLRATGNSHTVIKGTKGGKDTKGTKGTKSANGANGGKGPQGNTVADSNQEELLITVDGKPIAFSKAIKKGSDTLVPLRDFCGQYHVDMEWNTKKKQLTLSQ